MQLLIEKLLIDYRARHSEFQIDNFIIGKAGDSWSRYNQALREIEDRYKNLISQKENLELMDLRRDWRWPFGRRAQIRKIRRARNREMLVSNIDETERELSRFVQIAAELKEKIGQIDDKTRAALDARSWKMKALQMAGLDIIVNRRISHQTMELIVALPVFDRDEVMRTIDPKSNPDPRKLIGICEIESQSK